MPAAGHKKGNKIKTLSRRVEVVDSKGIVFLVSHEDLHFVKKHTWFVLVHKHKKERGYPCTNIHNPKTGQTNKLFYLHRALLNLPETDKRKIVPDHINGNSLDNRRCNLRVATAQQNAANCGQRIRHRNPGLPKGVSLHVSGRYQAGIRVNSKRIHLGTFGTCDEALAARIDAEKKYFGEFARKRD